MKQKQVTLRINRQMFPLSMPSKSREALDQAIDDVIREAKTHFRKTKTWPLSTSVYFAEAYAPVFGDLYGYFFARLMEAGFEADLAKELFVPNTPKGRRLLKKRTG
jgi:hypothetical protein